MKKKLTITEMIFVASMLFGMFFGAGNLIFPVLMGQMAGENVWPAIWGFLITGVGLPLMAVAALGMSGCDGLFELGLKVNRGYSLFFTCALYLTIGPFFAIPRCATVSYAIGITPFAGEDSWIWLLVFSLIFFLIVLWFSLHPGGILTWVGKILNPIFLVFLFILVVSALTNPMGRIGGTAVAQDYASNVLMKGFYEGYNTMDALAGLAFGIIVVTVIKDLGITEEGDIAMNTLKSGFFSCLLMGIIYMMLAVIGAQSRNLYEVSSNGGAALALVAEHYFGKFGAILLALIVTFACLKTAIGLVTSCAQTFSGMFPNAMGDKAWTYLFTAFSFLVANLGLNQIIQFSIPVLIFLYPLSIVLIVLALFDKIHHGGTLVYGLPLYCTLPFALLDCYNSLPLPETATAATKAIALALPLGSLGLGWMLPAAIGFVIGFLLQKRKPV